MKKYILISLLPLIVSSTVQAANISYVKVSACLSENSGKCLIEVSRYDSQMLESIESNDSKNNSDEISLLAKYYDYARQNQAANIVNLYSKADGSFDMKKAEVQKEPLLYAQFYKVGRIDVNRAVAFGEYRMMGVVWHDVNGKKLADWTELLRCNDSCELSQIMMTSNAKIDFMTIIASGSVYSGGAIDGVNIEQEGASQYPGSITFTIIQDDKKRIEKTSKSLVALYGSSKENIAAAQADQENLAGNILSVFDGVWANPKENVYTLIPNRNLEGRVFSASNLLVLSNFFSSLDAISTAAVITSESVDYIIYQGKRNDDNYYGFFPIGSDGRIVSLADLNKKESLVAQALQNPIIFRGLINGLISKAIDITPKNTEQFKIKDLKNREQETLPPVNKTVYWQVGLASLGLIFFGYILVRRIKK